MRVEVDRETVRAVAEDIPNGDRGALLKVALVGDYGLRQRKVAVVRRAMQAGDMQLVDCRSRLGLRGRGARKLPLVPLVARQLWRAVEAAGCQAIIVADGNNALVPFLKWFARRKGVPIILDAFDPRYLHAKSAGVGPVRSRLIWLLEKASFVAADRVMVVTSAMRDLYARTYGVDAARIAVMPGGVDEHRWRPSESVPRRTTLGSFQVLYWGRFHPHHGTRTILEAARRVEEEGVIFVMAGGGRDWEAAVAYAERLKISNVEFPGFVRDEDLVELAASSDVALGFFSDAPEALSSLGWKVGEALAIGLPVITQRSPAAEEFLTDGEDAYLVETDSPWALARAILELKGNRELRERLASGGRARYERSFSTRRLAVILDRIVREAVQDMA